MENTDVGSGAERITDAILYVVLEETMSNKVTAEQQPKACEEWAKWITGKRIYSRQRE